MRILIVEDHQKIRDLLGLFAKQEGHHATLAKSAEEALSILSKGGFDVIITDLMLPDIQGEELIKKIRFSSDVYIMVISAKIDIDARLDVISLGADDYIIKPFSVEEVMAKLKNVQKRMVTHHPIIRSFYQGELRLIPLSREVEFKQRLVTFTKSEFDVLWHLVNHHHKVFSRDELINYVSQDSEAFDRVIDAYVKNIRKKIGDDAIHPHFIKTHYGIGYQFVGEQDD